MGKESEQGLSAALGPRWDAKKIEEDADESTRALLRGISSPRALGAIHSLMGGVSGHSLLQLDQVPAPLKETHSSSHSSQPAKKKVKPALSASSEQPKGKVVSVPLNSELQAEPG